MTASRASATRNLGPLSFDIDEAKDNFNKGVEELKETLLNLLSGVKRSSSSINFQTSKLFPSARSAIITVPVTTVEEPSPAPSPPPPSSSSPRQHHIRLSTEYDSEESVFANKAKLRLLDGAVKLKASCQVDLKGQPSFPLLGLATPFFTVDYDVEGGNTLVDVFTEIGDSARVSYRRDVQSQAGSLAVRVRSEGPVEAEAEVLLDTTEGRYVPSQLAKARLSLPIAELRYVSDSCESEEQGLTASLALPLHSRAKAHAHVHHPSRAAGLKLHFKDENVTFSPCIELPSGAVRLNFKRRFQDAHKLSLSYDPVSYDYNAVYKFKPHDHFKFKAGCDKSAGLAWASVWLGSESDGCSSAPSKLKSQLMLQVPYEGGIEAAGLLFRLKKRIDFL